MQIWYANHLLKRVCSFFLHIQGIKNHHANFQICTQKCSVKLIHCVVLFWRQFQYPGSIASSVKCYEQSVLHSVWALKCPSAAKLGTILKLCRFILWNKSFIKNRTHTSEVMHEVPFLIREIDMLLRKLKNEVSTLFSSNHVDKIQAISWCTQMRQVCSLRQ